MFRRILAVVMVAVMLTFSGCYSLIAGVGVVELREPSESSESNISGSSDSGSYVVTTSTTYPSNGKDAFYIDENQCVKSEIEEFHVMAMCSTTFLYYYTAKSTRSGADSSGFYCLATYDYENAKYTQILAGYYNKENGSASMAYDIDANGTGIVCISNTFVHIENMEYQSMWYLSYDFIKSSVGGDFICYDLSVLDYYSGLFRVTFSKVPTNDDDSVRTVVYRIHVDDNCAIDRVYDETDVNSVNICDNYEDWRGHISVALMNSENSSQNIFKFYVDKGDKDHKGLSASDIIGIGDKKRGEDLLGFSIKSLLDGTYMLLLYDDRVELHKINYDNKLVAYGVSLGYEWRPVYASRVAAISLDNGFDYVSFDNTPSIVVRSSSKIYTCDLKNGFRCFTSDGSTLNFADGAYYAAYSTDGANCTLIGFKSKNSKVTTVTTTRKNGSVVSTQREERYINGSDLPYAKVYSVYVGIDSFPVNAGTIVVQQPADTSASTQ